jgi:membrane dipeptidase
VQWAGQRHRKGIRTLGIQLKGTFPTMLTRAIRQQAGRRDINGSDLHLITRVFLLIGVFFLLTIQTIRSQSLNDARPMQARVLGVDGHNDTVQRILMDNIDIGKHLPDGEIDLPRLQAGGIHVPVFALWVPWYYKGAEAVRRTLDLRDAMQQVFDRYPDRIELATSASAIERIVNENKIAAVLSIEGGHQIDDDLAVLRMYRGMGILSMTLTHTRNNSWADSSGDKPEHDGLTDFGKNVVREMDRIGMVLDVSHVSDKTFFDVLQVTTKPVIASHSSCRSISDIPRNMSDEMLRALSKNGGVVGVNFGGGFLNSKDLEYLRRLGAYATDPPTNLSGKQLDDFTLEQRRRADDAHPAVGFGTVEDAADCIDHIVKVAGIDHVGIGSDFDGVEMVPRGLEDVSKMSSLTAALLRRGYTERDIRKIMGENFLRVIRAVVGN